MLRNLLTHLLSSEVNTVSTLFARSQAAPLDFNLALWEAQDKKYIRITGDKIKIIDAGFKAELELVDEMTDLQRKCYQTILHYDKHKKYVPQVEFFSWTINASMAPVYEQDAILGALNWLVDAGLIFATEAINPRDKDEEDPNKFVFYYITPVKGAVKQLFALANQQKA